MTESLTDISAETILSGDPSWITTEIVESLTTHPLECVTTEFPHFVGSIDSPGEIERPKDRHPVFYGCYDWHSAVHSHWCLIRLLRLFDTHPVESDIIQSLDSRFTIENVNQEISHLATNRSFEKPYGWAWFLRLAVELHLWDNDRADDWKAVLHPLEEQIIELVESEFLSQKRPFRVATHHNSAFALQCILDYARITANDSLTSATEETAREFFLEDTDYPVEYEPLGWDFLSPALTEADLMRRVLDTDEFGMWIDEFLPDVTISPYETILHPVDEVPEGGVGLHLVGLDISKAWSMAGIATALDHHRFADVFKRSAEKHTEVGLKRAFTDDYAGTHWLSSFVVYLLTRNGGGIAPN